MPEHIEVILRSITSFSLLLVGTKILGKQTISQMTMFDFVATISLGAIAANLAFNTSIKVHHTIIAFTIYIAIIFLMALISLKNSKGRKFLAGDPTIVMQNGKILEGNMNKMRYTLDYLNQQLRERDIFNIEEVLFAIVETNGTLTVLKKPQFRNVTKQDLMVPVMPEQKLPIELIMDGEIIKENLEQNNITFSWLESELIKRNLLKHDVVYAVLAANGNLYVDTFRDHIHSPIDKE
ncbi:hypothetical protein ASG97_01040 [Bacillus sp. Soil745]|uniref:DUF421 domain-containing protein n=1 Tax=Peribacillus TaxID=2675229 RepID=UPI00070949C3|nr:DUF421 domain-containing protein [Peribacillus frigoritolerans]KRF59991.1 hypothetical protein ASG97_01040 [Bacillus sp. Soil745]MED3709119.1 DUF421 domain-containing protein [Peribacillus frigoritolerans]CAH0237778.1 hypothetical protein SRABI80_02675 [Peribacillus frigoritolerans]